MRHFSTLTHTLAAVLFMGTAAVAQDAVQTVPKNDAMPIIFVHGNGDDASKWVGTIWLFESNGYPSDKLYSIRFSLPVARTDDTHNEPFRSSTTDSAAELSAFVTRVLLETKSTKVALIGSSRGGLTMRNYILNGGGRNNVAIAIFSGTPNHGVVATDANLNGEFNGKGRFLQGLNNASGNGSEVVPGIRFLTLRSDKLDKYAQPSGVEPGSPQTATSVGFEGPSLQGATNLVLPNLDHRELAFQPAAFTEMYKFITNSAPKTTAVTPEPTPIISGVVTGFAGLAPTNLPLANAHLRIYPVDRTKSTEATSPIYDVVTGMDGKWGPFAASSTQEYDFDLEYQGRHVRYYKAPLLRSSGLINLRFVPAPNEAPSATGQTTTKLLIARPQGYFSRDRDPVMIDGKSAAEEPNGLPTRDSFIANLPTPDLISVVLRGESVTARPSTNLTKDLPIVDFLW
jgi:pimeloyl-ACP methyl ester carboxylesterase